MRRRRLDDARFEVGKSGMSGGSTATPAPPGGVLAGRPRSSRARPAGVSPQRRESAPRKAARARARSNAARCSALDMRWLAYLARGRRSGDRLGLRRDRAAASPPGIAALQVEGQQRLALPSSSSYRGTRCEQAQQARKHCREHRHDDIGIFVVDEQIDQAAQRDQENQQQTANEHLPDVVDAFSGRRRHYCLDDGRLDGRIHPARGARDFLGPREALSGVLMGLLSYWVDDLNESRFVQGRTQRPGAPRRGSTTNTVFGDYTHDRLARTADGQVRELIRYVLAAVAGPHADLTAVTIGWARPVTRSPGGRGEVGVDPGRRRPSGFDRLKLGLGRLVAVLLLPARRCTAPWSQASCTSWARASLGIGDATAPCTASLALTLSIRGVGSPTTVGSQGLPRGRGRRSRGHPLDALRPPGP